MLFKIEEISRFVLTHRRRFRLIGTRAAAEIKRRPEKEERI